METPLWANRKDQGEQCVGVDSCEEQIITILREAEAGNVSRPLLLVGGRARSSFSRLEENL
jgi:hypothetical protein